MIPERRLYVKVHRQALKQYMAYRGLTVRGLAAKTTKPRLSPSTIGHLTSGERPTCSPETAQSIERALDVPPGTIFEPTVCNVLSPTTRKSAS